jgi:hypothetical protein
MVFELSKDQYRDLDTDEEVTQFTVKSEQMERPAAGDTPAEALEVVAACFKKDGDERGPLNWEELAEEPDDEDWLDA